MARETREVTFRIVEEIAVLSTNSFTGWTKELNIVAWNDNPPKYDIREWSPNHDSMSRGITLSAEEVEIIKDALDERFREEGDNVD